MKNNKIVDASQFIESIKPLVLAAASGKKLPKYTGPEITHCSILASDFNIKESLRNLKHDEEQGRDTLDVVLIKIFQMGFQNGYLRKSELVYPIIEILKKK